MGLILDTNALIAGERLGEPVRQILQRVQNTIGKAEAALSAVSIVELTHGTYRARTDANRERRMAFLDDVCRGMIVHPVSLEIARLAGRIEGTQAAQGVSIAFEDLLIGGDRVAIQGRQKGLGARLLFGTHTRIDLADVDRRGGERVSR